MSKDVFKLAMLTKVRHGALHAYRERYGTHAKAAEALGVSRASFFQWYTLRRYPLFTAELDAKLRDRIGKSWAELWPPEVREEIDRLKQLDIVLQETTTYQDVSLVRLGQKAGKIPALPYRDQASQEELRRRLDTVLATLGHRERQVMQLRAEGRTYEQIGHELHVSRERIRQIEARAVYKLQQPSRASQLVEFSDGGLPNPNVLKQYDRIQKKRATMSLKEIVDEQDRRRT